MTIRVIEGDCRTVLATLPPASVQCCVTSPPYFGLRDYNCAGQIGLEPTPDEYVTEMVAVFREVRRVLRDDGTLWLNIGESYASGGGSGNQGSRGERFDRRHTQERLGERRYWKQSAIKPKDLIGIPWMLAFALRADGWYLRQEIIWHKPNPMPESVRDRCTKAHENVFLLTKSERYFWDAEAIKEGATGRSPGNARPTKAARTGDEKHRTAANLNAIKAAENRNARSVWTIATQPFGDAHFATMPPNLAERCILAGSRPGDAVLDPFAGAGTTGLVADRLQRDATLIELNPEYAAMARRRVASDAGIFASVAE